MHMKVILSIVLASFCANAWSAEQEAPSIQAILVSAKFLGGCGILSQMAIFQDSTKMAGGNEFIIRFMSTEAARLGMTVDQYMAQCKKSAEIYQLVFDAAEEDSKSKK